MKKERLEAFSDGLFSVVITIMVLELRAPIGRVTWDSLLGLVIALAFWYPYAAVAIYVGVAIMWVLPDRELEEALTD